MGIQLFLAAAATTAASAPVNPQPQPSAWTIGDLVLQAVMLAWLVVAIFCLVRFRVFSGAPLRQAPARPAAFLLPLAFGTIVLYVVFLGVALGAGIRWGVIPASILSPPKQPATSPAAASTPSTDASATSLPANAPPTLSPMQDLWAQMCTVCAELAAVGVALACCAILFAGGLDGMGLHPRRIVSGLGRGALGIFVLYPLLYAAGILLELVYEHFGHSTSEDDTVTQLQKTQDVHLIVGYFLLAVVAVPIVEEIFFRGILQSAILQRPGGVIFDRAKRGFSVNPTRGPPPTWRRWTAIAIASAIFAALHPVDHFPLIFLLALGLGYMYERTGNLYTNITMHAIFNATTLTMLLLGWG